MIVRIVLMIKLIEYGQNKFLSIMFLSYEPDFRLSVEKSVDNIVVFFNLEQCTRFLMCIINAFLYVGGCLFYERVY